MSLYSQTQIPEAKMLQELNFKSYLNVLSHVHGVIVVALEIRSFLERLALRHDGAWRLMSPKKRGMVSVEMCTYGGC